MFRSSFSGLTKREKVRHEELREGEAQSEKLTKMLKTHSVFEKSPSPWPHEGSQGPLSVTFSKEWYCWNFHTSRQPFILESYQDSWSISRSIPRLLLLRHRIIDHPMLNPPTFPILLPTTYPSPKMLSHASVNHPPPPFPPSFGAAF